MSDSSTNNRKPGSSSRVYLKIFLIVLTLAVVTFVGVGWLLSSERAAQTIVAHLIKSAEANGYKAEFSGLSGSLKDGVELEHLSLRKTAPYQQIVFSEIQLTLDFGSLLTQARVLAEIDCNKVGISGAQPPVWFKDLPNFPETACLANLPGNFFLSRVKIEKLEFKPFSNDELKFEIADANLMPPDAEQQQSLILSLTGLFRDRQFATATFSANLSQKKQKLEGRIEACFAGKPLSCEIVVASKKGQPEFSGHIASATLDLTVFSRWLIPLWQDAFPFGFDGLVNVGGSWIYSDKLGFLGNLNGDFKAVRMVAQGLFLTIFELNGAWKFFDGNLELTDSGSQFAGFPAVFEGKIEEVATSKRRFNLTFKADKIDLASFYSDLPWGIKYGSGIPEFAGDALFDLHIRGILPDVSALFKCSEISVKSKTSLHDLSGQITFQREQKKGSVWKLELNGKFAEGIPALFERFHRNGQNLAESFKSKGGLRFVFSGKGSKSSDMEITGNLSDENLQLTGFTGRFKDGLGRLCTTSSEEVLNGFASSDINFTQLILGY